MTQEQTARGRHLKTLFCFLARVNTRVLVSALAGVLAPWTLPLRAQAFSAAWERRAADGEAKLREIERLISSGDLLSANKKLDEEVAAEGESSTTQFLKAKILFRQQRYRESLKVLEHCLSLGEGDAELYKLAASDAILLNRMDVAEQSLKSAIRLAPNDYLAFFHLGALYYTDSRFALAQPVLEKSVSLNTDYVPARLFLGLTLEELEQEQRAADCYRRAIELSQRSG